MFWNAYVTHTLVYNDFFFLSCLWGKVGQISKSSLTMFFFSFFGGGGRDYDDDVLQCWMSSWFFVIQITAEMMVPNPNPNP